MKRLFTIALLLTGLCTATNTFAQKAGITAQRATAKKGYTVINQGEQIIIYKYAHSSHSPKETEKYAPKYFFILKSTDALQELTKANLKKAFPENHAFHDALDANFKEDKELINYDDFHKMYKLNWIYKNTIKESIKTRL